MWGRKSKVEVIGGPSEPEPPQSTGRLKDALRKARVDQAERSGVVVDLHDAEVARLELLNEALDPVFEEMPAAVDIVRPRHQPGRDPAAVDRRDRARRRWGATSAIYRFVQDTRYGRKVLAETGNVVEMVDAVTRYLAQRLVERERALADGTLPVLAERETRGETRGPAARSPPRVVGVPVRCAGRICHPGGGRRCCSPGHIPELLSVRTKRRSSVTPWPSPGLRNKPREITSQRQFAGIAPDPVEIVGGGVVLCPAAPRRPTARRPPGRGAAVRRASSPDAYGRGRAGRARRRDGRASRRTHDCRPAAASDAFACSPAGDGSAPRGTSPRPAAAVEQLRAARELIACRARRWPSAARSARRSTVRSAPADRAGAERETPARSASWCRRSSPRK